MIYTRFGTPVQFVAAQKKGDGLIYVRAKLRTLKGQDVLYGRWFSLSEFAADGGLSEIVETATALVPK